MATQATNRGGTWRTDDWIVPGPLVILRRFPFTIALIASMLVVGAISGTMFHPIVENRRLYRLVAYGVPALREGRLWTLVTSVFFTWQPWMLQTITLSVLLFVAPLEFVAGSRRAALAFFATHVTAYFLTSILVSWPLSTLGSAWGHSLAHVRDVGASAGAFGCAGALTWFLPWRVIRAGQTLIATYLGFWLVATHQVWDVEHAVAYAIGYGLGLYWVARWEPSTESMGRRAQALDRRTIRLLMAALTALIGLINIASVLLARVDRTVPDWADRVPGTVLDESRSFVLLAGFLLILLARGLAAGRRTAWLAALILLEGSAIAHLLKGLHVEEATLASVAAIALATQKDLFRVRPDVPSLARSLRSIALFAAGFVVYAALGLFLFRNQFSPAMGSREAIEEFFARLVFLTSNNFRGDTERARWFLDSLSIVWVGLVVYVTVVVLRPRLRPHEVTADDRAEAEAILRAHGRTTTSPMTLWPGNTILLSGDRRAYLAYRLVGDVALVLGDPIGPADALPALVDDFLAQSAANGWTVCFYAVTPHVLDLFSRRGFATIQVAEDAILWLDQLEFKGKRWQDVRTAINKAGREGVRFEWFDQSTGDAAIRDQLWEISRAWVAEKGLPEMGFTLGQLTDPPDPTLRTAIAIDAANRVHAFATWLPVYAERGWVVDLMRRRPDAMKGVMEFLIAESALHFRAEGYAMMSLSSAPLAHVGRPGEDVTALQRGLDVIAARLDAFYHFAPLFEFKRKFDPAWSPVYLAYPGVSSLPKITLAIVRAYLPGLGVPELAAQLGAAAASLPKRFLTVRETERDGQPLAPAAGPPGAETAARSDAAIAPAEVIAERRG